ncbi:hypothetical protein TNCV_178871 [Trichonephila clavipes]|nr:hypothetical protein TNCV_178871 [Trichonephila clavipes]
MCSSLVLLKIRRLVGTTARRGSNALSLTHTVVCRPSTIPQSNNRFESSEKMSKHKISSFKNILGIIFIINTILEEHFLKNNLTSRARLYIVSFSSGPSKPVLRMFSDDSIRNVG